MEQCIKQTPILDYGNPAIQQLIENRKWRDLHTEEQIKSIYNFVRDEIKFGYSARDDMYASEILKEGFGQCNTKSNLLMALLRGVGIPTRMHGFTIDKELQKGAIRGLWYWLSPNNILHSWVEVWFEGEWYFLEGVILDKDYLKAIQQNNPGCTTFCGFGIYTDNLVHPEIEWNKSHTFIQQKGINNDYGIFESPDEFYARYRLELDPIKSFFYRHYIRHQINRNVERIRRRQK